VLFLLLGLTGRGLVGALVLRGHVVSCGSRPT
jgi:hypothetical protein